MKYLFIIMLTITSSLAIAHDDPVLGEGVFHLVYHLIFWTLFAAVVVKGITLFIKSKRKDTGK